MQISLHKNSRTTFKLREEIKNSSQSISFLSKKYALDWKTVKKWKVSNSVEDKSSRPKRLRTDLTTQEEDLICFHRKQFKSTIEEIFFALEHTFKDKKLYPMKIYRCLRRYGLQVLPKELKKAEREVKRFRKYTIGYLHIDFIFTKRFNKRRYYVFTCIDRVSKLAYVKLTNSRKSTIAVEFLREVLEYYPYKINYILTDNGSEFTDTMNRKHPFIRPKKRHAFDQTCIDNQIQPRHTKFKSPWTNGMVERFNRTIKEKVIQIRYFKEIAELAKDLVEFMNRYNFETRLKALNYRSPVNYLKESHKLKEGYIKYLTQTLTTYRY
jgi:transposase InsO family protein